MAPGSECPGIGVVSPLMAFNADSSRVNRSFNNFSIYTWEWFCAICNAVPAAIISITKSNDAAANPIRNAMNKSRKCGAFLIFSIALVQLKSERLAFGIHRIYTHHHRKVGWRVHDWFTVLL
jgi:hypothetical protein